MDQSPFRNKVKKLAKAAVIEGSVELVNDKKPKNKINIPIIEAMYTLGFLRTERQTCVYKKGKVRYAYSWILPTALFV